MLAITFRTKKLAKVCQSKKLLEKEYNVDMARKILQRLQQLQSCDALSKMYEFKAARFHPLQGKRKGQYAVDLVHPFRLVLRPVPEAENLDQVVEVEVIEITDYH